MMGSIVHMPHYTRSTHRSSRGTGHRQFHKHISQIYKKKKETWKETNFKGTVSELNIYSAKVYEFAAKDGIAREFNPPTSPHMGRVWENMVRTVKRVLYSMMKNTMLADFQLMTIFTEIENIINNCPLTDVSDDFDDLEALTPNHFLLGKYNNM